MEKKLFISPSTLDRKSLILTLVVCGLPILFSVLMLYRAFTADATILPLTVNIIVHLPVLVLFLIIFVLGIIITPYKYILTDSHLITKRLYKNIVIPLQDITHIKLMTPRDKSGMIRTFGAEGAFGSWGYYRTPAHKKLTVFARRYNNWTLIITDREKYVIAPDDPRMIDVLAQHRKSAQAVQNTK